MYYLKKRRYSLIAWFWDAVLTVFTCGLWLIRIYVREMRNR